MGSQRIARRTKGRDSLVQSEPPGERGPRGADVGEGGGFIPSAPRAAVTEGGCSGKSTESGGAAARTQAAPWAPHSRGDGVTAAGSAWMFEGNAVSQGISSEHTACRESALPFVSKRPWSILQPSLTPYGRLGLGTGRLVRRHFSVSSPHCRARGPSARHPVPLASSSRTLRHAARLRRAPLVPLPRVAWVPG